MANLKEVRLRIASVSSTMQITAAMKLVAAAKMRKTQRLIQTVHPYTYAMNEILKHLISRADVDPMYTQERTVKSILLVVLSSNKGLCGGFNGNVVRATKEHLATIKKNYPSAAITLLSIGKKGSSHFLKHLSDVTVDEEDAIWDQINYKTAQIFADRLIARFVDNTYQRIEFLHNHFISAGSQKTEQNVFLPFPPPPIALQQATIPTFNYLFEPDANTVLNQLVKQYLQLQVLQTFLDSAIAEHAARMTSMHQATDNAQTLITELTLHYNKARQSAITNEIIEISSSAEALHH